jgi:hypothetical protein
LTNHPPAHRLALVVTLVLSLGVLVAALLGPAETLAQTRKPACSTSAAHTKKAKSTAHVCTQATSKGKSHHAAKHSKRKVKKTQKSTSGSSTPIPASCEDGNPPVLGAGKSFSCGDGSEPQCVDGATPKISRNGKSLLCPASTEGETSASEAECEEEGLECTASSDSSEQACEASASNSPACEVEVEDES